MRLTLIITALIFAIPLAAEPATRTADDAWPLYDKAARRIHEGDKLGIYSPSSGDIAFADYHPFSALWEKTAKGSYDFNASALEAVHQATAFKAARWPVIHQERDILLPYLDDMRNIANE